MYARKDIRTVLPDAVLRCRKIQTAADAEREEMEKAKLRRLNTIHWQEQTFERTVNEKHKRWRVYDRAFRLKLKRELGADLAAALRMRTIQDEEEKLKYENDLIEKSFAKQKKAGNQKNNDDDDDDDSDEDYDNHNNIKEKVNPQTCIKEVAKSNSAFPKANEAKVIINKPNHSAVNTRLVRSAVNNESQSVIAAKEANRNTARRPRTSRFESETSQKADKTDHSNDFGSVLLRILSNIAATPDLEDDFTIRRRALEARERRLIQTRDDRYFNLIKQLSPIRLPGDKDSSDSEIETY